MFILKALDNATKVAVSEEDAHAAICVFERKLVWRLPTLVGDVKEDAEPSEEEPLLIQPRVRAFRYSVEHEDEISDDELGAMDTGHLLVVQGGDGISLRKLWIAKCGDFKGYVTRINFITANRNTKLLMQGRRVHASQIAMVQRNQKLALPHQSTI